MVSLHALAADTTPITPQYAYEFIDKWRTIGTNDDRLNQRRYRVWEFLRTEMAWIIEAMKSQPLGMSANSLSRIIAPNLFATVDGLDPDTQVKLNSKVVKFFESWILYSAPFPT